jgi:hypothetical protein
MNKRFITLSFFKCVLIAERKGNKEIAIPARERDDFSLLAGRARRMILSLPLPGN